MYWVPFVLREDFVMSRASVFLQKLESHYHYSKLDKLYSERAQYKVDGKRPPRTHKHYAAYRDLTKKIRKVRSNFAQKIVRGL